MIGLKSQFILKNWSRTT